MYYFKIEKKHKEACESLLKNIGLARKDGIKIETWEDSEILDIRTESEAFKEFLRQAYGFV